MISKFGAPPLKTPLAWSEQFRDFLSLCLKMNPSERPTVSELLNVGPFIVFLCIVFFLKSPISFVFVLKASVDDTTSLRSKHQPSHSCHCCMQGVSEEGKTKTSNRNEEEYVTMLECGKQSSFYVLIRMLKQETEREKKDSLHCFVKRVTNV
jgi:serine/threonine protein kinase